MPADLLFTAAARRHFARLAQAVAPLADRLDRRFLRWLRRQGQPEAVAQAVVAIAPAAVTRLGALEQYLERVETHGRQLAKYNLPPAKVHAWLRQFGDWLGESLQGRFAPSREQLHLAAVLALDRAYYQVHEAESQALFGIYRAEAEAAGAEALLRAVADILTRTLRARMGRLVPPEEPPGKALEQPRYIERGSPAERLIRDPALRGRYPCYWSFPLARSAVLQMGFAAPGRWLPRDLALLEAAAERSRAACDRAALEARVRRLEAEARQAEELERRRIGRELHDETGQLLLLLRLKLEMLEREAEGKPRAELAEARALVERTVVELRRIIAALSPALLERLGLPSALRQLSARAQKLHPARVAVRIASAAAGLPLPAQEVVYRVAQESLHNIARHSGATRVNLSLLATDKVIRLRIADNGKGFDPKSAALQPSSFGLAGMRERAGLLGGSLVVRSREKKGTCVVLDLPRARGKKHVKDTHTVN